MKIRFEERAREQVRAAHAWWKSHRLSSPQLFAQEVAEAINHLKTDPLFGRPYTSRGVQGVRRILCRRTRYHLYYLMNPSENEIVILAVWSGVRGRGPSLKRA